IEGVTSEALARALHDAGHKSAVYLGTLQEAVEYLLAEARPGDAVLTIGAGSVSRASGELVRLLEARAVGNAAGKPHENH
ncbi:MAG TPA: UDP-N-acetylmuramate--L-alanine ligase, partial [Methylomirabilota bacterium]|nr:UDP-N-acetylmuramate--L-alanine ligase [Methylomirabilota bacterium]